MRGVVFFVAFCPCSARSGYRLSVSDSHYIPTSDPWRPCARPRLASSVACLCMKPAESRLGPGRVALLADASWDFATSLSFELRIRQKSVCADSACRIVTTYSWACRLARRPSRGNLALLHVEVLEIDLTIPRYGPPVLVSIEHGAFFRDLWDTVLVHDFVIRSGDGPDL